MLGNRISGWLTTDRERQRTRGVTRTPGPWRQAAAILSVLVAAGMSLATSTTCRDSVDNQGTAGMTTANARVTTRYRVLAPPRSDFGVNVKLSSAGAAAVRVTLLPDDPSLWPVDGGGWAEPAQAVVSGASREAHVGLGPCNAPGCTDYAFTLTFELTEGTEAVIEWTAQAEVDECTATKGHDSYYFEVRRD
jgi:hypothetical protein